MKGYIPLTPSFTRATGSTLDVVGVGDNRIGTEQLFEKLNIRERLPNNRHMNSSKKSPRESYLTPNAVKQINLKAARDFQKLGYEMIG